MLPMFCARTLQVYQLRPCILSMEKHWTYCQIPSHAVWRSCLCLVRQIWQGILVVGNSRSCRLPIVITLTIIPGTAPRVLGVIFYMVLIAVAVGLGAGFFVSFSLLLEPFKDLSFAFGGRTFGGACGSRLVFSFLLSLVFTFGVPITFALMAKVRI